MARKLQRTFRSGSTTKSASRCIPPDTRSTASTSRCLTLGLTYPQFLVMLALWERDGVRSRTSANGCC